MWPFDVCAVAAGHGQLAALQRLRELVRALHSPCPWHAATLCAAARSGHKNGVALA